MLWTLGMFEPPLLFFLEKKKSNPKKNRQILRIFNCEIEVQSGEV